jgi:hypothetical protein
MLPRICYYCTERLLYKRILYVEMDVFLYEKMANRFSRSTHEFYACSLW